MGNKKALPLLSYFFLILGACAMLLPFFWMLVTSIKTPTEVAQIPPVWWPKNPQWHNYIEAFKAAPFARYLLNSVIVTFTTTIGEVIISILAAYAFAKMQFYGKNLLFLLFLGTMMVPGEMLLVPNFVTLSRMNLINTYGALIIPWLASMFSMFTLKQNFQAVPDALRYAAKTDGCGEFRFLWTIMVPLGKSSIVAIGILKMIGSWNAFMWPLIVTNDTNMRTLPVGLQAFTTDVGTQYQLLMAASTMVILPMVLLYIVLQKYIIDGISKSGLKG